MLTFHNKPELKEELIKRAIFHRESDMFSNLTYLTHSGRGCLIGCLHRAPTEPIPFDIPNPKVMFQRIERDFGIPVWLCLALEAAYMSRVNRADYWRDSPDPYITESLVEAIPVGAYLDKNINELDEGAFPCEEQNNMWENDPYMGRFTTLILDNDTAKRVISFLNSLEVEEPEEVPSEKTQKVAA